MRKRYIVFLSTAFLITVLISCLVLKHEKAGLSEREKYSLFLQQHPFNNHPKEFFSFMEKEGEEENETDRPNLAWEQDYLRIMDPALGRPAEERLSTILRQMNTFGRSANAPGSATTPWVERGPNNVGGRTRAIEWDPNDSNGTKVWAGGVTGGLWYNNNITLANSPWNSVNDFWSNIAITCIAFDPNNAQIMYVGTGEGWGAGSGRGAGIWKSTDGGGSWSQISSTTGFYYVNDLMVRNESGASVVYAAVDGGFYKGVFHGAASAGLQRSTNGGTTWTQVLPTVSGMTFNYVAADIEINSANRIWIGSKNSPYGGTDRGGGRVLYSDNGTSWTISNTTTVTNGYGRVELACAKSNANVIYEVVEDNNTVKVLNKTINAGTAWNPITLPVDTDSGIPSTDYSRGQAWYDLILAVDPTNENNVIAGGVDLFRSINGGTNWSQISKWSNNNNMASLNCSFVHADQHAISYKPGSSSTLLVGNDGGIFYTTSISTAASASVFSARNNNYNVTQFYACAMHPAANSTIYLAGAQDNGSQRFTSSGLASTTSASGGDGAFCFIDQNNPAYQITAYVYNTYYLSTDGGTNFSNTLVSDQNTGKFINPADYDDNQHVLFSGRGTGTLNRIRNITTSPSSAETVTITGLSDNVSHIRVSPYTTTSSTLFLGTDAGSIWKVTTANATPTSTNITGSGMPTGTVSCIEIGASDSEMLVTYFNYGVTSVWYTSNAGTSWVSKEGNLPDMPVRWALFNPNNRNEVLLATELGVWSTTNLNAASPTWATSNSGLANVRVDMLQIRNSDLQVTAATYGRGLFTSNGFAAAAAPAAGFVADKLFPCLNETVTLSDTSVFYPTSWTWTITPNTFNFVNGSSASSKSPKIQFTASGNYSVTLSVSNASGTNQVTRNALLTAGGFAPPFLEDWETASNVNRWTIDNQDLDVTWALANVSGNAPGTKAMKMNNYSYSAASTSIARDGLISPVIRLAGFTSASLSFKYAYRRYNTTFQDSLAVYVSTDCGNTWIRMASYKETQASSPFVFVTNTNTTNAFTPSTTADWCGAANFGACKTISLNTYAGQNIKIKFESISGNGNNLYLDDINVTGSLAPPTPVANFNTATTTPCMGAQVNLRDTSTNTPTSWNWTITPNTFSFINGTTANSQHPFITFSATGNYTIKLKATNGTGSDSITKTNFIVVSPSVLPAISIQANDTDICALQQVTFVASITNGGTTPVYQWKINGVTKGSNSSTFITNALSNGDTITCTLTSNVPCAVPATVSSNNIKLIVHPKPAVSFALSTKDLCLLDTNFILSGVNPTGGIFSGTGVTGNIFKPLVSGAGSFIILYAYTDIFGCSNTVMDTMHVNALPTVTLSLSSKNICFTDTTFNLTGGAPTGGVYSGTGVAINQFKTSISGAGNFAITYTVTNAKGCVNKAIDTLHVNTLPVVGFALPAKTFCALDSLILLTGGSPTGGIYSGNGVTGNQFKPLTAGAGNSLLTYTFTNAKGCANKAIDTMHVNSLPIVTFMLPLKKLCATDTTLTLTGGLPSGGIFTGTGVVSGQFKTSISGAGGFPLTYTFTDLKGCANKAVDTLSVFALPAFPTLSKSGDTLTSSVSGASYQWYNNGSLISGATGKSYIAPVSGLYKVRVANAAGCFKESAELSVTISGLKEIEGMKNFTISPNPSNGTFNLDFILAKELRLGFTITDIAGRVVYQSESVYHSGAQKTAVILDGVSRGSYLLKITDKESVVNKMVVVE